MLKMVMINYKTKPEIVYSIFKMGTMCAIFEIIWDREVRENPIKIEERGAVSANSDIVARCIQSDFKQASKEYNGLECKPRIIDYNEIQDWTLGVVLYHKRMLVPYKLCELEEFRKALASKD